MFMRETVDAANSKYPNQSLKQAAVSRRKKRIFPGTAGFGEAKDDQSINNLCNESIESVS
jgi:hypothetical protein